MEPTSGQRNLISVIIPTFNRLKNIETCLLSVKSQTEADFEIIVVDDASTENLEPIKSLADKFIINEINGGPGCARNLGFLNSVGEIILFLDSDVVLRPRTLKKLIEVFNLDEKIGAVGGCGPADETGLDVKYIMGKSYNYFCQSKKTLYHPNSEKRIFDCEHLESAFLAVRRDIFEKIGGFDPYWHYGAEERDGCLSVKALGYRVVASLETRAIHNSVNLVKAGPDPRAKFWLQRYLEVAVKRGGLTGGLRWFMGNWQKALKPGVFFKLLRVFKNFRPLTSRKGLNFLSPTEQDKFFIYRTAQLLGQESPFKINYPLKTPENIVIFLTLKCNAKCEHCFLANLNSDFYEMSLTEISKIIDSLDRPANILLTGGEIFLRPDLNLILDKLMSSPKVKSVKLSTNGSLPEKIESICEPVLKKYHQPLGVQISLDGLKEIHEQVRNLPGCFDKAIETGEKIQALKNKYPQLSLVAAITVMKDNLDNIMPLVDFLEQKNIPSKLSIIRGNSFSTFGVPAAIIDNSYEPRQGFLPAISELEKLLASIAEKYPFYFNRKQKRKLNLMLDTLKFKKRQFICYAGYQDAVIFSTGEVALCEQVKPFASLSDCGWNFKILWNGRGAWQQRLQLTKCACIHGCNISTSLAMEAAKQKNIFKKIIKRIKSRF